MSELKKEFRERLIDMETINLTLKEKYEKELKETVEKKIKGIRKIGYIFGIIMCLGLFVVFGTAAIMAPKEFPWWGRTMFVLGALFSLTFIFLELWILKKGTINLKTDEVAMAGLGWGFIVIMATVTMVFSGELPNAVVGIRMLVILLIFEIATGLQLLKAYMKQYELNIQERLLEIEYKLAEISEKMNNSKQE